jgi:hypothetical protein
MNLNDIAVMTGFSTRTLRNHMKAGLLEGEKIDGVWQFTEEQFTAFINDPNIKAALRSKNRGYIYDFIADDHKANNSICVVLDLRVGLIEANEVSAFFCKEVNKTNGAVHFSFNFQNGNARVILTGPEDAVQSMMAAYYKK